VKPPVRFEPAQIVAAFAAVPALKTAGALAGANALYLEHIPNSLGRFSFDLDLQNQQEDLESVHRRFSVLHAKSLRLVSRLSEEIYEYQIRLGRQVFRVEISRPYLRHRRAYAASKHVAGLAVVSLADLLFAKVSAFSTRGLPRDLIDLYAIHRHKQLDWEKLLLQAARASDNDFNPTEFHRKLREHHGDCGRPSYWRELPVMRPPSVVELRTFIEELTAANQTVGRLSLA
jgi:predicted nucleotidyltransferase component of viral defense system